MNAAVATMIPVIAYQAAPSDGGRVKTTYACAQDTARMGISIRLAKHP